MARYGNRGMRFDYFIVNKEFYPNVQQARIKDQVYGSDHCPIELVITV